MVSTTSLQSGDQTEGKSEPEGKQKGLETTKKSKPKKS